MEHVKHVICYGQTKEKINEYCKKINKDCIVLDNLEDSTKAAYNLSEKGDVILFSPACASWDQFDNFEIRGDLFKKIVEELKDND
jgi:UDP-N-acetylmuramoylalanine--D-glutamate ligase